MPRPIRQQRYENAAVQINGKTALDRDSRTAANIMNALSSANTAASESHIKSDKDEPDRFGLANVKRHPMLTNIPPTDPSINGTTQLANRNDRPKIVDRAIITALKINRQMPNMRSTAPEMRAINFEVLSMSAFVRPEHHD
jgi:hypothetical protein